MSVTACFVACLSATYQGAHIQLSVGALGFGGWAASGGVNTAEVDDQNIWYGEFSWALTAGTTAHIGDGVNDNDPEFNAWAGGGVTVGEGVQLALMVTLLNLQLPGTG